MRSGWNDVLAEVCRRTARSPDPPEAIEAIARLLGEQLDARLLEVWKVEAPDELVLMARHADDSPPPEAGGAFDDSATAVPLIGERTALTVVGSGAARTWGADAAELEPAARETLAELGVRDVTALPIHGDGDAVGVALLAQRPDRSRGADDDEGLDVVLSNVAILLQRLDRMRRERTQASQLDRLTAAIQNLPIVVKMMSPDWVIEFVNPAVEDVLGYAPEELVGKPVALVRDAGSVTQEEIAAVLLQGAWTGDRVDRHKDGHAVPVRLVIAPVLKDGRLESIIEIARDLTDELDQETRAKDAYRMSVVGHLAAAVAHEVNNPLAAITMMTRVLLEDPLPAELKKDLEIINAEAHRAGGISRNLLAFARHGDTQKFAVALEPVVEEVVRLKLPELRLSRIDVDVALPEDLPRVSANAGQIRQILHNLISNSAQAILEHRDHGGIRISAARSGAEWVELVVEDDGPGIPERILDRVMNPFFTTKPVGRGTGLGLSVCRDIVNDHGGEIVIGNRPPAGTGSGAQDGARIAIRLPAAAPADAASEKPAEPAHTPPTTAARVLIIDDDVAVASTLQRLIARLGHTGSIEHRAEAAIVRLAAGEDFDVILTDLKMPGMGGEGVFRMIERERPELLDRLVFMSGDLSPESDNAFLKQSSHPTLAKPFSRDQLRDALDGVIRSRRE